MRLAHRTGAPVPTRPNRQGPRNKMAKLDEAEIARIVARAGDLGPRERFAYIKAACANDDRMRSIAS